MSDCCKGTELQKQNAEKRICRYCKNADYRVNTGDCACYNVGLLRLLFRGPRIVNAHFSCVDFISNTVQKRVR